MKLLIKKEKLLEGLLKVSKAVSTKNLVPALAGIKFDLTKDGLTLTATDNDIIIQYFLKTDKDVMTVEKEGFVILQGKYILDIVRKIPVDEIKIEAFDENKVIISTDNSEYNLNGISKNEYPNITLDSIKNPIILKNSILKDIVNQTAFATSTDESRPILTGINLKISGDILECNSTDSYRLSRKSITLDNKLTEEYNVVVPSKNLVEFSRIIDDTSDVEVHVFSNKIIFKNRDLIFQSRLINGTFPNTANFLPKEKKLTITLLINDFFNMIDRVSILTSDKEKNIVILETTKNKMVLKSVASEVGKIEESMIISKNNDEDIFISFNAKFMMDALRAFNGKSVDIDFSSEITPITLKDQSDETLIELVTPNRIY